MHSIASLSLGELKAYSKCAQVYLLIHTDNVTDSKIQLAKHLIINKEGDINFIIPNDSLEFDEDFVGGTLLHIAYNSKNSEICDSLLDLGADFTIKNESGCTALHHAFNMCFFTSNNFSKYQDDRHINLILSAHVKFANVSNPCNNDGLSHFHIACMANNVRAVKFFLKNKIDIHQAVSKDERSYAGYSPLHFAVDCYSIETIEILIEYGVDRYIRNGFGMTPLDQLLNRRTEIFELMIRHQETELLTKTLREEAQKSEEILLILLGSNFLDRIDIVDSTGLSSFHIACTMQDSNKIKRLMDQVKDINHFVNVDSPVWPGYTALHFAAHCSIDTMQLLCKSGASIHIKDAKGQTPFDICIKRGIIADIESALLLEPKWANIFFSNGSTKLISFISALQNKIQLSNFLCNFVDDISVKLPDNSPLWPGCTFLHLAVTLSKKYVEPRPWVDFFPLEQESMLELIEEILKCGSDVTWADANGRTPLHLAYQEEKNNVCHLLRKYHHSSANPVDKDNLSHLHIACAKCDEDLVRNLLSSKDIDVSIPYKGEKAVQSIKPGWSPLNIMSFHGKIRQMLLQHGAKESSPGAYYSTYELHSACYENDKDTVKRLLEVGTDVDVRAYDGRSPLHVAIKRRSLEIVQLLLQGGADLLAKDDSGFTPLSFVLNQLHTNTCAPVIFSVLKQRADVQKRMEKEMGITMLHIACYLLDVEEVKNQLDQDVEIDAQVHEDARVWPKFTALHILMTNAKKGLSEEQISVVDIITKCLLQSGADITLADVNNNTPLHISYTSRDKYSVPRTELMLKHQYNFGINPINDIGLSHFHLAVMCDNVELIEKFLERGANINQPPAFFANVGGGLTPLHMAINNVTNSSKLETVDLLLSRGADVCLEDADGQSALHKAIIRTNGPLRLQLVEKLVCYGALIDVVDVYGTTPFELLLNSKTTSVEEIKFFLNKGCQINISNPVSDNGYLGTILLHEDKSHRNCLFSELLKAPDATTVNELGRSIIHNIVAVTEPAISSEEYTSLFLSFKEFGYDIDDQDHAGRTALHLAAQFGNEEAILALLNLGADLNIVDAENQTALSYAVEICDKCTKSYHEDAILALVVQMHKLYFLRLYVSRANIELVPKSFEIMECIGINLGEEFKIEVIQAKNFTITPLKLTMHNFLSETDAIIQYCHMPDLSRVAIDKAFEFIGLYFCEIRPILNLQHRKAVMRYQLSQAVPLFRFLVQFPLPDLCSEIMLKFLNNRDLRNVIAAISLGS